VGGGRDRNPRHATLEDRDELKAVSSHSDVLTSPGASFAAISRSVDPCLRPSFLSALISGWRVQGRTSQPRNINVNVIDVKYNYTVQQHRTVKWLVEGTSVKLSRIVTAQREFNEASSTSHDHAKTTRSTYRLGALPRTTPFACRPYECLAVCSYTSSILRPPQGSGKS
jgi:hypothetical protein